MGKYLVTIWPEYIWFEKLTFVDAEKHSVLVTRIDLWGSPCARCPEQAANPRAPAACSNERHTRRTVLSP